MNFQDLATNRATAISLCVPPAPRCLEAFMNHDPRFALSQELEAKQTLLDQLRARLLAPLAFLSPRIIAAIVDGTAPAGDRL